MLKKIRKSSSRVTLVLIGLAGLAGCGDDPRDVYDRPPDLDTGRFLGDATVLPGQALNTPTGAEVDCALGRLSVDAWHGAEGSPGSRNFLYLDGHVSQ